MDFHASLHGDPAEEFPHFSGYADETGSGAGAGFNLNLYRPAGTEFALVVSLGVDTVAEIGVNVVNVLSGFEGG